MATNEEPHWASRVSAPAGCQPTASPAMRAMFPPGPTVLPNITTSGWAGMAANTVAASWSTDRSAWARCHPVIAVRAPAVTTIRVMLPPGLLAESYPTRSAAVSRQYATAPVGLLWAAASAPSRATVRDRRGLRPRRQLAGAGRHRVGP